MMKYPLLGPLMTCRFAHTCRRSPPQPLLAIAAQQLAAADPAGVRLLQQGLRARVRDNEGSEARVARQLSPRPACVLKGTRGEPNR